MREPDREAARAFARLVAVVTEFCPRVESVRLGVCAFGARGPARYFGGETEVARKIVAAAAAAGFSCRAGVAEGLFAALLAAGCAAGNGGAAQGGSAGPGGGAAGPGGGAAGPGDGAAGPGGAGPSGAGGPGDAGGPNGVGSSGGVGRMGSAGESGAVMVVPPGGTREFLRRQPVGVIGNSDLVSLLTRLGIRTLGDLAALPAADVVTRLGAAGEAAHRLACGAGTQPLATTGPGADLSAEVEFDPPETIAEPVVFAAKRLAERFHAGLAARGVTCVRMGVQVRWEDGREVSRLWRHDGLLTAVQVADRVRWQLDGAAADATDDGGVDRRARGWSRSEAGARSATCQPARWKPEPVITGSGFHRAAVDEVEGAARDHGASEVGVRGGGRKAGGARGGERKAGGVRGGGREAGVRGGGLGGITVLRLVPDQVVRATGHQLALWGDALITDRVARAAMRVQAILGHEAVLRPVLAGGRDVRDRVMQVPFGEKKEPSLPPDRPWPGRIPGPAPAVVYPQPLAARVTDSRGFPVTVTGRCAVSAPPARVTVDGEPPRGVTGWAGPWPLTERWWDHAAASRRARFQLATDDGRAWLAAVCDGSWQIEAGYW